MFIRSERLMLRPIFPEDWRELFAGIADESVVRMLARVPWPYTADHARNFCNEPYRAHTMRFAVTLPEEDGAPLELFFGKAAVERTNWVGRQSELQREVREAPEHLRCQQ